MPEPPSTPAERYSYDNAWVQACDRLSTLERRFDPGTIRHLEALGVSAGWSCLEIGAGGGSIAGWLSTRVGPTGHVLATDLDTRFVEALDLPNLETRRHDVAVDPLPSGLFDLVHARLLLGHIPNRELALRKMVEALKPGGTLLCEEGDDISTALVSPSDVASAALYSKVQDAIDHVMTERGHAADFGRRLFGQVRAFGLIDVEAEGRMLLRHAGAGAETARLTVLQLREDIISSGLATAADVASYIQLLADPGFVAMPLTLIAVWGRKPLA